MSAAIYLRELSIEDAEILYKWRNEPEIWVFTKFRPLTEVTLETETKWLKKVLNNKNEYRFAICLSQDDKYVGNVQLLNVENGNAELHIFVGVRTLWGKGIGKAATINILDFAFYELKLESIFLEVHKENKKAKGIYNSLGFRELNRKGQEGNTFAYMELRSKSYRMNCEKLKLKKVS
ncbi:GCN5-related N-acetyltransferase [Pseudopedobacter saltans DSM 12145]|uniref:GCN5-related N-acetyltransferase n=1 Tax=Pseudopedobacter saltans (strain ATCC 51119 / DSM 12145 / JCM 21818 / CCUG 39354 / LMG 10337 / NBRC 100064 / NCIMB 13643) TaxID=762903 RepID=F0S9Q0_PSESL|nr:GNAT family N-acetyltransferase [Pseudopedobacter saltans]ADY51406.1 GCN5-related N-acetyltransferase [Pseudopedobacter saltans DSM 12145]